MKSDQRIVIQLVDQDENPRALANIKIDIRFYLSGKPRYTFTLGVTDQGGQLTSSYDDIEQTRRKNGEFNLMDYNTRLDQCDSRITVVLPSESQLREQQSNSLRFYKISPEWTKDWPKNGQVDRVEKSVELTERNTKITLPATKA
jgi:hypothetical protein